MILSLEFVKLKVVSKRRGEHCQNHLLVLSLTEDSAQVYRISILISDAKGLLLGVVSAVLK
jgi:hypothetical protein